MGMRFEFFKMRRILETGCTTVWMYLTLLHLGMVKRVNVMSYRLYHNFLSKWEKGVGVGIEVPECHCGV